MNQPSTTVKRAESGARVAYPSKTNPVPSRGAEAASRQENPGEKQGYSSRCDPRRHAPLTDAQRELVTSHISLATRLVLESKLASGHIEEFKAEAFAALVEAAQSFDPDRNASFEKFARLRIAGALRDYRRFLFHASWRGGDEHRPEFRQLDRLDERHVRVLGRESEPPPGQAEERREAIESAIRLLPRSHSVACRMIYLEGKTPDEAARTLGVSRGFFSRLSVNAINWLAHDVREALAG